MKKLLLTLLFFSELAFGAADYLSPDGMTQIMDGVDDGTYHVPLGHSFPYYGGVFTDAWMSSNGFILLYDPVNQFGNADTWNNGCCSGFNPSGQGRFSYMLAPLWTDLRDANATPDAGYYYKTNSDESKFLWYNVNEYGTQNTNTFQVNLWPDGSFDFVYDEVDITSHNTWIGFTGDTSTDVTELQYAQGSLDEFGLNFISQTFNGGRAWWGKDGGYESSLDCSNALNDPKCPGYEQAYYDQQCSYDALYDTGCQGYEQAYFDLQCSYDDLYDSMCPGYDNAILVQNLSGQDFVFGDDISDFYDTDPIEETNMFPLYEEETNMFLSYEEETNMFTEPEIYDMPIEETYFEETFEEDFFDEPIMAAVEEEIYEEETFEELIAEESGYIDEQITLVEEDVGNIEEELPVEEVEVQESVVESENLVQESASSIPSVDAVSIALDTASNAQSTSLSVSTGQNESSIASTQSPMDNTITEQEQISIDQVANIVEEQISLQETNLQNFSASVTSEADLQDTVLDTLSQDLEINESEIALYDNSTFGSIDSAFGDATLDMMVDPSIAVIEISTVQTITEQVTQEEQTVEFQMESSTTQIDTGFSAQQDQSFSTGQSITAVLNNVAPNFSQFNVAPPSQQEQKTTQKADAQANNMSEEQLEQNLDEFASNMKDSGGFTDQSLTVFLMGRNSGFSQYEGQLQDVSFYTDRGMPGGSIQNDRNSMLRMMGTDNKHEQLISLQYGR